MTHYTVIVALPGDVDQDKLRQALDDVLAPYDENLEVAPYVGTTKAEIEADERFNKWWKAQEDGLTYEQAVKEWWGEVDGDGNVLSTYNPKSKWDWWVVGGRWAGSWVLLDGAAKALPSGWGAFTEEVTDPKRGDAARKSQIAPESISSPFAFVDLDGKWHEKGRAGWFGSASDEKNQWEWDVEFTDWFKGLPGSTWAVLVDVHI